MPIDQRIRDRALDPKDQPGLFEFLNRELRPVVRRIRDVLNAYLVPPTSADVISGEIAIDWNNKRGAMVLLSANATLVVFTDPVDCGEYVLLVTQDGGGHTIAGWPGNVAWPAATPPVISATDGRTDKIVFFWDGTTYWPTLSQDLV